MDSFSASASVAAVATLSAQLAKALFQIHQDLRGAEIEHQEVANNVSLLSMVLETLEGSLKRNANVYRPQLQEQVKKICLGCRSVFADIEKVAGLRSELRWLFKKERARLLQSSLESLKSTLNVLLHVISLARMTLQDPPNKLEAFPMPFYVRTD